MDYTMEITSVKGKEQQKLTIEPSNSLEREFFNTLFAAGTAVIETVPNSEEIVITRKKSTPEEPINSSLT